MTAGFALSVAAAIAGLAWVFLVDRRRQPGEIIVHPGFGLCLAVAGTLLAGLTFPW